MLIWPAELMQPPSSFKETLAIFCTSNNLRLSVGHFRSNRKNHSIKSNVFCDAKSYPLRDIPDLDLIRDFMIAGLENNIWVGLV